MNYTPNNNQRRMANLVDGNKPNETTDLQDGGFVINMDEPAATIPQPSVAANPPAQVPVPNEKRPEKKPEDDKEKYSIYLPKPLGYSLRKVYMLTRRKYSHIVEDALTEVFYQRYKCHSANCHIQFTLSDPNKAPMCCPACGCKDVLPIREDTL